MGARMVASSSSSSVGFQLVSVTDPQGPPLELGIWYPASAATKRVRIGLIVQKLARNAPLIGSRLPLVAISHGTVGSMGSHGDTALVLAEAGFIVAAPVHTGDNYVDQSDVGGPSWFVNRPRHISATIDYLLRSWPERDKIDAARIGLFGFSAGGFTSLIAIGGVPDLASIDDHCARTPELACRLWYPKDKTLPPPSAFLHDARIKAAVITAPAFGFVFVPDGLKNVKVPVQLWGGSADINVPTATNTGPVHTALGDKAELHLVEGAGHLSFLTPEEASASPLICPDAEGFDREAFLRSFNAAVTEFFKSKL